MGIKEKCKNHKKYILIIYMIIFYLHNISMGRLLFEFIEIKILNIVYLGNWMRQCTNPNKSKVQWSPSVQFSGSVMSNSLQPHESQHTRPPCPSPTPGVHSNSCPLSRWCHPAISSFVIPFSSCPRSLPASGSFPVSQLFAWGGQSTGVSASASFPPKKSQDWSPSEYV